jgi:hypothetical protein
MAIFELGIRNTWLLSFPFFALGVFFMGMKKGTAKRMSVMIGYGVAFEGYMKRVPMYLKITVQGGSGADIVISAMLVWIALL